MIISRGRHADFLMANVHFFVESRRPMIAGETSTSMGVSPDGAKDLQLSVYHKFSSTQTALVVNKKFHQTLIRT